MAEVQNATTPTEATGVKRFFVAATPPKPQPSRQQILDLIVKLLREKGAGAVAQIKQKVKAGQGLTLKGVEVDTGVLRDALEQVEGKPAQAVASSVTSTAPAAAAAAPRPVAGTISRWLVGAPSASALAQKALQECETAEPFCRQVKNVSAEMLGILSKPSVTSHATGEHIPPGAVVEVIARSARVQDGRTYLRLKKSEGWVSTRSHSDLWKVVLTSAENGATVEPVGSPTTFQSRAAQVLPRVNADGRKVDKDGRALQASDGPLMEPRSFRVAGGRGLSILTLPNGSSGASGLLQAREEFQADAVCIVPAEGRAYLRLKDGRGWVCERSKAELCRYALEPVGFHVHQDECEQRAAPRKLIGGHAKTFVVERPAYDHDDKAMKVVVPKPSPRCAPLKDEAVVLRSDVELWPKLLGEPRPIKGEVRLALRRHSRFYYRKVKECEEDLKEVELRVESYARACDGKKTMQSHAETLRKEIAKIEQEWKAAIEKDIAGVDMAAAPKRSKGSGRCTVAPVQVLGEAWHCAVIRTEQDDGEGGKSTVQFLGPLRQDAGVASEDLQRLSSAVSKRGDVAEDPPSSKKRPVAVSKTADAAEDASLAKRRAVSKDVD